MNLQEAAPIINRSSEPDVIDSLRHLGGTGWWTTKIGDDGDRYVDKPATTDQVSERLLRDEVQRLEKEEAKQRAYDYQLCGTCGSQRQYHDDQDRMPSHEFNNEPWIEPEMPTDNTSYQAVLEAQERAEAASAAVPGAFGSVDETKGSLGRGTGTIHAVDPASHEGAVED